MGIRIPSSGKNLLLRHTFFWLFVGWLTLCGSQPAWGHLLNMTEAQLELDPDSGSIALRLQIDLLRAAGTPEEYLQLAQNLKAESYEAIWRSLSDAILIEQDGVRLPLEFVEAAPPEPFDRDAFSDPFVWPRLWVSLTSKNYQPKQPITVLFTPRFLFEEPIAITITDGTNRLSRWLITNQRSPAFLGSRKATSSMTTSDSVASFLGSLRAGFTHILPYGWDHLLFVLAVLLMCTTLKQIAMLITAFTIGHSASLAIAGFKLINASSAVVEPLILLSISLYALRARTIRSRVTENARGPALWPVALIGLLHGLGFASAFNALGWAGSPAVHLFGFNLGIELAQLVFVVLAYIGIQRLSPANIQHLALVLVVLPLGFVIGA